MKPSVALGLQRDGLLERLTHYPIRNPRVFGSVLHGTDQDGSDLDVLVVALPETTLFDLGGLQDELAELVGVRVDLVTPGNLPTGFRSQVLDEARAI